MTREHAYKLREILHKASASLSDEDALSAVEFFPIWKANTHYTKPIRVRDPEDGFLYRLIPDVHDSQEDWSPRLVPAIWTRVDEPEEEWPEWRQPLGAEDAYPAGSKVSHNGHHWINSFGNGNVWEPGVYGWDIVE